MEASIYAVLVVESSLRVTDVHADDEIVGVEYPCLGYEAFVDCRDPMSPSRVSGGFMGF